MEKFQGILGILTILGIAFLLSNNKKRINYRLVISGLSLQWLIGILIMKVSWVSAFFSFLGRVIGKIELFASKAASFVYGNLLVTGPDGSPIPFGLPHTFVFAFNITATIIFVCVLVAILYHVGIMQKIVEVIARGIHFIMGASGAETLSNVASAFVGQVEAQVMIRPYLSTMTMSELLTSMAGSMACIAGGILVVYVNMGAKAEYLLAASLMAAPAAIVISKIIMPEVNEPVTAGKVKLEIKKEHNNLIDAISHGASDGMKISINVIAMLLGFLALIYFINYLLHFIHHDLSLDWIFGKLFYPLAWLMGVPASEADKVAMLMGQKLAINEFVAFKTLTGELKGLLSEKALAIASFAICGFANFASVGIQIGGIGALVPERRSDLSKLGIKALIAGTLSSYLSASIAGILV
jgi:CNT family concentrative nucleoside transporter